MMTTLLDTFDKGRLFLGIAAPQHEYDGVRLGRNQADDGVGKLLPSLAAMRRGIGHLDGQHTVEQQYALLGPMFEKTMTGTSQSKIAFQLLVDVDQ